MCLLCFKDHAMKGIIVDVAINNIESIQIENDEKRVVENWKQPRRFVLPEGTQVVTIKARRDYRTPGGILASFSNGNVTDNSWSCIDCGTFSDAHCESYSISNWEKPPRTWNKTSYPEIASSAQWIWVNNLFARRVWCRKTFGEFK